ncbi:MAG: FAD-dependent oxidoreductase [Euzebyaceae bacterium]|nr:FAD-dependent oxidoreductase [Euzebyaceae bacterium]
MDVVILGAGLAGLVAARALRAQGASVALVDRSDVPGGRLASRRIGAATLDHGAQFFTVRSHAFAALVRAWTDEGCPIRVWSHGFAHAPTIAAGPDAAETGTDGHPRYVVGDGMQTLGRHLAVGTDARFAAPATAVAPSRRGWRVVMREGRVLEAKALICTPPLPESLGLLNAGGVDAGDAAARLRCVRFEPCLVLLAVLDRPVGLPPPGGVQFAGGPVTWLADNATKGVSAQPALTVHAAADWSVAHDEDSDGPIAAALLALSAPWTRDAIVERAAVARWRHSRPVEPLRDRCLVVEGPAGPLVLAGDAFGGAKVEGAALSGLAAAAQVQASLALR